MIFSFRYFFLPESGSTAAPPLTFIFMVDGTLFVNICSTITCSYIASLMRKLIFHYNTYIKALNVPGLLMATFKPM